MRPIIGITGNYSAENRTFSLKDYYVNSIADAGGIAVILPSTADDTAMKDYFAVCQGFLFTGGGDFDPVYWGELPEPRLGEIEPVRDEFELKLANQAFQNHKAVLGICRGCQAINVALGGSLVQDINSAMSHRQKAPKSYPFHDIFIEPSCQLRRIMNNEHIRVNSFHHQAVKKPGRSVVITAMAAEGTVEAIESPGHPFYLGVQWHPECLQDQYSARLFAAFIAAAQICPHL
ncbi:MAG: gamma-glutamyl-gamma-aminobutyrate hydrolase family protein [Syntrophomonas sp.]|nr:gamma-glutamyl-gamma-aminobutyrate hydrolase family protein [Syntrophomonas sp.]